MSELARKAERLFTYALPLLITEFTHYGSTDKGFHHFRKFPDENETKIVKLNSDTLYSTAFTQLAETPYIIHIPDNIERYYLFPILNGYTEVIYSIGTRTPELSGGDYIFLYRDSEVPKGYENYRVLRSNTSLNAVLLRIETRGEEDYAFLNRIQDSITIKPLYEDRVKPVPGSEGIVPPIYAEGLSAEHFLEIFAELEPINPIDDSEIAEIYGEIGDYGSLDEERKKELDAALGSMWKTLAVSRPRKEYLKEKNGWVTVTGGLGRYDGNYTGRANVSWVGWGANIAEDSVYANAECDSDYKVFDSGRSYRLHINEDEYPHAAVFWSVSLYGEPSKYIAHARNGRHKINSHDVNNGTVLKNDDGSLDIFISRDEPADGIERTNWLPAPSDEPSFSLVIRIYWPDEDTLKGNWEPPIITQI